MKGLINIPTAAAPPAAPRWPSARERIDLKGRDSFAETLDKIAPKRETDNRESELAAASQAAAQERRPEIVQDDPPKKPEEARSDKPAEKDDVKAVQADAKSKDDGSAQQTTQAVDKDTTAAAAAMKEGVKAQGILVEGEKVEPSQLNQQAAAQVTQAKAPVVKETSQTVPVETKPQTEAVDTKAQKPVDFEAILKAKGNQPAAPVNDQPAAAENGKQAGVQAAEKTAQVAPAASAQSAGNGKSANLGEEVQVKSVEKNTSAAQTTTPAASLTAAEKLVSAETILNEPARMSEARSSEVVKQISQAVEQLNRTGQSSLRLQLSPADLGKIDLRLTQSADGLQVVIHADQASTGRMLESSLNTLRQTLQDAGITLSQLSVGQGNQQQTGQGWSGSQNGRRQRVPVIPTQDAPISEVTAPARSWTSGRIDFQA